MVMHIASPYDADVASPPSLTSTPAIAENRRSSRMEPQPQRPSRVRHIVLGLTVAAYMITYMDRVVISAAVPTIQKEFGFSLITMSYIISSFRWGYALVQIPGGWLGDRIGPRRALTLIVAWWSMFTSATAFAWNSVSMI